MLSKKGKATRRSFIISLVVHGILFVALAFYIFNLHERVEEAIEMAFIEPVDMPEPRPRKPYKPKVIPKPIVVATNEFSPSSGIIEARSARKPIAPGAMKDSMKPAIVTRYSDHNLTQGTMTPSALSKSRTISQVATAAKIVAVDKVSFGEPSSTLGTSAAGAGLLGDRTQPGGGGDGEGSGTGRGSFGVGHGRNGVGIGGKRPGLSLKDTTRTTSISDTLEDVAEGMSLGDMEVPPLPQGEPGGRVIGRGKDIKGVFRFVRLKHNLADWWDDPTSVIGIAKWLNANTQIRADMNVEGGALKLTDANLMKAPLALMTGHDPALLRQDDRFRQAGFSTDFQQQFTQAERTALRRYLLEKGGMLFFDDCGHNSVTYPLKRKLISELQAALPEYLVKPIPNDHEIYTCFYNMGPPPGAAQFWGHGPRGKIPKYLEGLFIDGRLAVLLSGRDYLCAAETIKVHSGKISRVSSVYRFLTNVVVYSLTHGKISDYSNYVPEDNSASVTMPRKAPAVPKATLTEER
ncbi:MAG: DUF4159 domain-containing protein [Candidatus Poribacteria bacterium]